MSKLWTLLPLAAVALVGCGATTQVAPSRYAYAQTLAAAPALQMAGIRLVLSEASAYRTQATVAEVASIRLTVTPASGAPVSKTVAKGADMAMDNLAPGKAVIKVEGLNAASQPIGTVEQGNVDLLAGQTTTVKLTLKLQPTVVSSAGLGVDLTLVDGDVVYTQPSPAPSTSPTTPPAAGTLVDESFENGLGAFNAAYAKPAYLTDVTPGTGWNSSAAAAQAGTKGATAGGADGKVTAPGAYTLTLKNAINTSALAAPKVSFAYGKFTKQYYFKTATFAVEASTDNGATWTAVWSAPGTQPAWTNVRADLPRAAAVKVRFNFTYDYYLGSDGFDAPVLDAVVVK
ncbi:MAG: hypothetical protein FJY99_08930 [Candidatus Sericytochromatia bacterium]|nr:hypothetical protein [Candidatus Tanganyikabacteria bacterium]